MIHSAVRRVVVSRRRLRTHAVRVVGSRSVQMHFVHPGTHGHGRVAICMRIGRRVGTGRRRVRRRLGTRDTGVGTVRHTTTASSAAVTGTGTGIVGFHFGEGGHVSPKHLSHVGEEGRHCLHHGRLTSCSLLLQLQVLLFDFQHGLLIRTAARSTKKK